MANRKKASGFVTEDQRHTERLTLRLKPEVMAKLRELADCTKEGDGSPVAYSKVIEAALFALEREIDAIDDERAAEEGE